jgi:hypothetical protein
LRFVRIVGFLIARTEMPAGKDDGPVFGTQLVVTSDQSTEEI